MVYGEAVVFPGQGAQSKGMGKDIYDAYETARIFFNKAKTNSVYTNKDYAGLCFDGSDEELQSTINTQPAIYIVSVIFYELLKQRGFKPNVAAGHSLGEYSALYAAGVFSFEDGLRLLEKRAAYMDECAKNTQGTMAAIMGLDEEKLNDICASSGGIASIAGINSPGQIVISGEISAVKKVIELAKAAGSGKCIELKVSGAWHSKLMSAAQEKLAFELNKINFNTPEFQIISNCSAEPLSGQLEIKNSLIKQLCAPVRWVDSVENMVKIFNIERIIEAGPGKVLTGLIKRINKNLQLININNLESLEQFK